MCLPKFTSKEKSGGYSVYSYSKLRQSNAPLSSVRALKFRWRWLNCWGSFPQLITSIVFQQNMIWPPNKGADAFRRSSRSFYKLRVCIHWNNICTLMLICTCQKSTGPQLFWFYALMPRLQFQTVVFQQIGLTLPKLCTSSSLLPNVLFQLLHLIHNNSKHLTRTRNKLKQVGLIQS